MSETQPDPRRLPAVYLAPGPYAGGTAWPAGPPPGWHPGRYPAWGPPAWGPPARTRWDVPPPPGTPYDQMARTALNRWWRPIAGTLAIVATFVVVSIGAGLVAYLVSLVSGVPMTESGARLFADPVLDLGFQLGVIALLLPLVLGAAWVFQRRPPGSLSSVALRLRWRWLAVCLLVALVSVVLGQAAEAGMLLSAGAGPGYGWAGWGRSSRP